jgi:hypothetical protein
MYDPMGRAARLTEMPDRVRRTLSCATGNSFAAGTLVMMADGSTKPIEDVKVGDTIENADVDSGVRQQHAVTAVHVTDDDTDFVDLAVGADSGAKTITVTAHHLFWDTTTHQWAYAADLRVGDQLDMPGDGHVAVASMHRYTKPIRTYNLTIASVHTYYVLAGPTPVLVHNSNGDWCTDAERIADASDIGNGHAGSKHAGDFPGLSVDEVGDLARDVMQNPARTKSLGGGRKVYQGKDGSTIVIHDPMHQDGGTIFRRDPTTIDDYWEGLK